MGKKKRIEDLTTAELSLLASGKKTLEDFSTNSASSNVLGIGGDIGAYAQEAVDIVSPLIDKEKLGTANLALMEEQKIAENKAIIEQNEKEEKFAQATRIDGVDKNVVSDLIQEDELHKKKVQQQQAIDAGKDHLSNSSQQLYNVLSGQPNKPLVQQAPEDATAEELGEWLNEQTPQLVLGPEGAVNPLTTPKKLTPYEEYVQISEEMATLRSKSGFENLLETTRNAAAVPHDDGFFSKAGMENLAFSAVSGALGLFKDATIAGMEMDIKSREGENATLYDVDRQNRHDLKLLGWDNQQDFIKYQALLKRRNELSKPTHKKNEEAVEERRKVESEKAETYINFIQDQYKDNPYRDGVISIGKYTFVTDWTKSDEDLKAEIVTDPVTGEEITGLELFERANMAAQSAKDLAVTKQQIHNHIHEKNDFYEGITENWEDKVPGLNLLSLADAFNKVDHVDRIKKRLEEVGDPSLLSQSDRDYLDTLELVQNSQSDDFLEGSYGYKMGNSVGHSLTFMMELAVSRGSLGLAKNTAATTARSVSKLAMMSRAISKVPGKGLLSTLQASKVVNNKFTRAITSKAAGNAALVPALMPSTYKNRAFDRIGTIQKVQSIDGKQLYLLDDRTRNEALRNFRDAKEELERDRRLLDESNIPPEKREELTKNLDAQEEYLNSVIDMIYDDEKDELRIQDVDKAKSFFKNYFSNSAEVIAETVTGPLFGLLGKGAGRAAKWVAPTKYKQFNRYLAEFPRNNVVAAMNKAWSRGEDFVNYNISDKLATKALGRNAAVHSGGLKIWNNLPTEIAEEVIVQVIPNPFALHEYTENVKQLLDTDFYIDVGVSTLIMGGGFSALGSAQSRGMKAYLSWTDKDYKDQKEKAAAAREVASAFFQDLEEKIGQNDKEAIDLLMTTSSSTFDQRDINTRIAELEKDGSPKALEEIQAIKSNNMFSKLKEALETGTISQLRRGLRKAAYGNVEGMSPEAVAQAKVALDLSREFEAAEKRHEGKLNKMDLINYEIKNFQLQRNLEDAKKHRAKVEQESQELYDGKDPSLVPARLANTVKEKIAATEAYIDLIESQITDTQDKLYKESRDSYQKEIFKAYKKARTQSLIASANSENVESIIEKLKEEGEYTPGVKLAIEKNVRVDAVKKANKKKRIDRQKRAFDNKNNNPVVPKTEDPAEQAETPSTDTDTNATDTDAPDTNTTNTEGAEQAKNEIPERSQFLKPVTLDDGSTTSVDAHLTETILPEVGKSTGFDYSLREAESDADGITIVFDANAKEGSEVSQEDSSVVATLVAAEMENTPGLDLKDSEISYDEDSQTLHLFIPHNVEDGPTVTTTTETPSSSKPETTPTKTSPVTLENADEFESLLSDFATDTSGNTNTNAETKNNKDNTETKDNKEDTKKDNKKDPDVVAKTPQQIQNELEAKRSNTIQKLSKEKEKAEKEGDVDAILDIEAKIIDAENEYAEQVEILESKVDGQVTEKDAEEHPLNSKPEVPTNNHLDINDETEQDDSLPETEDNLFTPVIVDTDNSEHKKKVGDFVNAILTATESNPNLTFESLLVSLRDTFGASMVDSNFNFLSRAWNIGAKKSANMNTLTDNEFKEVFNRLFVGDTSKFVSLMDQKEANKPPVEVTDEDLEDSSQKGVESKDEPKTFNPVNKVLENSNLEYQEGDSAFKGVALKLGRVLGLIYEKVAGKLQTVKDATLLDNVYPFLNYNNFKIGDKVEFVFDFDLLLNPERDMVVWQNPNTPNVKKLLLKTPEALKLILKGTPFENMSYEDIQKEIKNFQAGKDSALVRNEEFLKYIPVGIKNKKIDENNNVTYIVKDGIDGLDNHSQVLQGGLSEYYWFNDTMVASKVDKRTGEVDFAEKKERMSANRQINLTVRNSILENGSYQTTVTENRVVAENKPESKGFNSILSQFKNDINEFKKHAAIAVVTKNFSLTDKISDNKKEIPVKIDGVSIEFTEKFFTKQNLDSLRQLFKNHNKPDGRGFKLFIYKSGRNKDGSFQYSAKAVLDNHGDLQNRAKRNNMILTSFMKFVNDNNRQDLRESFKREFGVNLTTRNLDKFSKAYMDESINPTRLKTLLLNGALPHFTAEFKRKYKEAFNVEYETDPHFNRRIKEPEFADSIVYKKARGLKFAVRKVDDKYSLIDYRQDKSLDGFSDNLQFPILEEFNDHVEFIEALTNNPEGIQRRTAEEAMLSNLHTNMKFTEIGEGANKVFTPAAQPYLEFDFSEAMDNQQKRAVEKNIALRRKQIETLEKEREATDDVEMKNKLTEEINVLKSILGEALDELIPVNTNGQGQGEGQGQGDGDGQGEGQGDGQGQDTSSEPYDVPQDETYNYNEEVEFLEEYRDDILGYNGFKNSIRQYLTFGFKLDPEDDAYILSKLYEISEREYDALIKETKEANYKGRNPDFTAENVIETLLDRVMFAASKELRDSSAVEKDHNKSSFEVNITESLSFQAKLILSNIENTQTKEASFAGNKTSISLNEAFGALHELLSDATNNTLADIEEIAKARVAKNPEDLAFFLEIIDRLKEVEKSDPQIIKELMYMLYQPKVGMRMTMWSLGRDGEFSLESFDANSNNPMFAERAKWVQNLKQNSSLVTIKEGSYIEVDKTKVFQLSKEARDLISANTEGTSVDTDKLEKLLREYGIDLNSNLIKSLNNNTDEARDIKDMLLSEKNGMLAVISKNLEYISNKQGHTKFTFDTIEDSTAKKINPLTKNNSRIKKLIAYNQQYKFQEPAVLSIAGKNIYAYQQPNAIYNTVKFLKESISEAKDENGVISPESRKGLLKDLRESPITKHSFILDMLENNPELIEEGYFDTVWMSLESFKKRGAKSSDKNRITTISDKDAFLAMMGMYTFSEGAVKNTKFSTEYGLELRKAIFGFPTLSDASQMPLLNSIAFSIDENHVDATDEVIGGPVLDLLTDKMVRPELERIADYLLHDNGKSDVEFYNQGARWINSFHTLNSLAVPLIDVNTGEQLTDENGKVIKDSLINIFRTRIEQNEKMTAEELVNELLSHYKEEIQTEINEDINSEVNSLMGQFKDFELIDPNGNLKIKDDHNGYYEGKSAKVVAYDYMINNILHQYEIQNLFAGDISNYFKTKKVDKLNEVGLPEITFDDILKYYYPKDISDIYSILGSSKPENLSPEAKEKLFEKYPKFKYLESLLAEGVDYREAFENLQGVSNYKMKLVYKDVQNNLSKRLKQLLSPGNQFYDVKNLPEYYQVMVEDVEGVSQTLDNMIERAYPEIYKDEEVMKLVKEAMELSAKGQLTSQERGRLKAIKDGVGDFRGLKKMLPLIAPYLENATTDAQEYVSWQDNLAQLFRQGRISQVEYDNIKTKLEAQEADLDNDEIGNKIQKKNELTELEERLAVMTPSKPLYSGREFNTLAGGHKAVNYVYIKSSSFPILPKMAQMFPKMNGVRKVMKELGQKTGGEVRVAYGTAVKVGGKVGAMSIYDLQNGNVMDASFMDRVEKSSRLLSRNNFYIQQDKPYKSDKNADLGKQNTGVRATQFEKIILGDGINRIERYVFPAEEFDKDFLSSIGVNPIGGKLNGPQLTQIYNNIYKREQDIFKDKILRKLGITDYTDISEGNPVAMEKLAEMMKSRLDNMQDIEAMELIYETESGEIMTKQQLLESEEVAVRARFKLPPHLAPNSHKFESVLNSMVNKNSINLKLPGSSSPVGSQEGFDMGGVRGYEDYIGINGAERGLVTTSSFDPSIGLKSSRFDPKTGEVLPAQVLLANNFKYMDSKTRKYKDIDFTEKDDSGNYIWLDSKGNLDFDKLPQELVSMFTFRIPTSSHQSGSLVEVVGFLPKGQGDLMIVPQDHTVQIGEDYDIDVRYMYNYNMMYKDGKLKKLTYSDIYKKPKKSSRELSNEFNIQFSKAFEAFHDQTGIVDNDLTSKANFRTRTKSALYETQKNLLKELSILDYYLENFDSLMEDTDSELSIGNVDFQEVLKEDFGLLDFTKEELERKRKDLEGNLASYSEIKKDIIESRKDFVAIRDVLKYQFKNEKSELGAAWREFNRAKLYGVSEQKVLENNLVSMYKAVFQGGDSEVQDLITKVLSTETAEKTADLLESKTEDPSARFNMFSPINQREIMKLGADGKIGIGSHSNYVTLNSLLQQLPYDPKTGGTMRAYSHIDSEGNKIPFNIVLGDLVYDGVFGRLERNGTRISEPLMESQNSATDNQKLQIMGRRNENSVTMGVLSNMQMNGLEKEGTGVTVGGVSVSYPSLFISQPVITELVERIKKSRSETSGEFRLDSDIIDDILDELIGSMPSKYIKVLPDGKKVVQNEYLNPVAKTLNGRELYRNVGAPLSEMKNEQLIAQYHILKTFASIKAVQKDMSDLNKIVNIENEGLGKSYFDTIHKFNRFRAINNSGLKFDIPQNVGIKPAKVGSSSSSNELFDRMFGTFKYDVAKGDLDNLLNDGYIILNSTKERSGEYNYTLIKPTTHYSHKIANSLSAGYNLWNSLFPYDSEYIEGVLSSIAREARVTEGTARELELNYRVMSSLKDYLYMGNTDLFGSNPSAAYKKTFFQTENQESLAGYLKRLESTPETAHLFSGTFFKNLSFQIEGPDHPSIIKYNNSNRDGIENIKINNVLEKEYQSEKILPHRKVNGKMVPMRMKDLIRELAMYSIMADQANGAIGFRNYIPQSILDDLKITDTLNKFNKFDVEGLEVQNVAFNGLIKSIEKAFSQEFNVNTGEIFISAEEFKKDYKRYLRVVEKVNEEASKFGLKNLISRAPVRDSSSNEIIGFKFTNTRHIVEKAPTGPVIKQIIQHNPDIIPAISVYSQQFKDLLSEYAFGNLTPEQFFESDTFGTTAHYSNYIAMITPSGERVLYERYNSNEAMNSDPASDSTTVVVNHYRRIPVLGTFGFNEYKVGLDLKKSMVKKNNPPTETRNAIIDPLAIDKTIGDNTSNLSQVLNDIVLNSNGRYKETLSLFGKFVPDISQVQVKLVENLQGPAMYSPKTNTVYLDKNKIKGITENELQDKIIEEFLHYVTVNSIGKYGSFVIEEGTAKFVKKDGIDFVPAEIYNILSVYNEALDHYKKKYGKEEFIALMDSFKNIKKDGNNSLTVEQGSASEVAYYMHDAHEFLAHLFIKDSAFAKEMGETKYKESSKSMLGYLVESIVKLMEKIFPNTVEGTISHEGISNLVSFLMDEKAVTNPEIEEKYKKHRVKLNPDNKVFAKGLSMFRNYQQNKNNGIVYDKFGNPITQSELDDMLSSFETPSETPPEGDGTGEGDGTPETQSFYDPNDKVLRRGSMVSYQGKEFLYWNDTKDGKAKLATFDAETGEFKKRNGSPSTDKLTVLGNHKVVDYKGNKYLVTDNQGIFSLQEGRQVFTAKDGSTTKKREDILNLANDDVKYQKDIFDDSVKVHSLTASEKELVDLSTKLANRIGIKVTFVNQPGADHKGFVSSREGAFINLANATLDTPIHEIMGHPIIAHIKNLRNAKLKSVGVDGDYFNIVSSDGSLLKDENGNVIQSKSMTDILSMVEDLNNEALKDDLYTNLLKELEKGAGKRVYDKVREKTDLNEEDAKEEALVELLGQFTGSSIRDLTLRGQDKDGNVLLGYLRDLWEVLRKEVAEMLRQHEIHISELPSDFTLQDLSDLIAYSNGKIVLDSTITYRTMDGETFFNYEDVNQHIKDLYKSMADFDAEQVDLDVGLELTTEELEKIAKLEEEIEAIQEKIDGKDIEYNTWKAEELAKYDAQIDDFRSKVSMENLKNNLPINNFSFMYSTKNKAKNPNSIYGYFLTHTDSREMTSKYKGYDKKYSGYYVVDEGNGYMEKLTDDLVEKIMNAEVSIGLGKKDKMAVSTIKLNRASLKVDADISMKKYLLEDEKKKVEFGKTARIFVAKNEEYAISRVAIEKWKKDFGIVYDPREAHLRGEEFYSVLGAYAHFDTNLMLQNMLSIIENNEKAGQELLFSTFTKKPNERNKTLEGLDKEDYNKVRVRLNPRSEDIKWAANEDAYSGSVKDSPEFFLPDFSNNRERAGVAYEKYPAHHNYSLITPSITESINTRGRYNELAVAATGNNFRLEYDKNVPQRTKNLVDKINKALDNKYGKFEEPVLGNMTGKEAMKEFGINKRGPIKKPESYLDDAYNEVRENYSIAEEKAKANNLVKELQTKAIRQPRILVETEIVYRGKLGSKFQKADMEDRELIKNLNRLPRLDC